MEQLELEFLAREVRRLARAADDELLCAPEIAVRLLGPDAVVFGARGTPARLDGDRIVVPPDHPDLNFGIGHELGEVALRDIARYRGPDDERERLANRLGAAILAPPREVARAHRFFGERLRTIARTFGLSQTSIVLRIGEVERDERAVVTRTGNVLVRTTGRVAWQTLPIVEFAKGKTAVPGLAKASLRGGIDEGRTALRVT